MMFQMKDYVDIISAMLYNIQIFRPVLSTNLSISCYYSNNNNYLHTCTHTHDYDFFTVCALFILLKTMLQLIILRTLAIDNRTSPFFVFLLTDPHFVEGS
jgi:hypothetical protein